MAIEIKSSPKWVKPKPPQHTVSSFSRPGCLCRSLISSEDFNPEGSPPALPRGKGKGGFPCFLPEISEKTMESFGKKSGSWKRSTWWFRCFILILAIICIILEFYNHILYVYVYIYICRSVRYMVNHHVRHRMLQNHVSHRSPLFFMTSIQRGQETWLAALQVW